MSTWVTSGTFAQTLEKALAMAIVRTPGPPPDARLTVDIRGTPETARAVPLPFYNRPRDAR